MLSKGYPGPDWSGRFPVTNVFKSSGYKMRIIRLIVWVSHPWGKKYGAGVRKQNVINERSGQFELHDAKILIQNQMLSVIVLVTSGLDGPYFNGVHHAVIKWFVNLKHFMKLLTSSATQFCSGHLLMSMFHHWAVTVNKRYKPKRKSKFPFIHMS